MTLDEGVFNCRQCGEPTFGLYCSVCKTKLDEDDHIDYLKISLWTFRIFGLIALNIFAYLDRLITMVAVGKSGTAIENNFLVRFFNFNPWLHLAMLIFVTAIFGIFYVKSYRKSCLALDVSLILVLTAYLLVIANNIIQLAVVG